MGGYRSWGAALVLKADVTAEEILSVGSVVMEDVGTHWRVTGDLEAF